MTDFRKVNFDYNLLKNSVVEKDVENAYRTLFSRLFTKYGLTSPYGCDGHLTDENGLNVLCEFKNNVSLQSKIEQVKVLIQSVFYLKKFENDGKKIPKVVFVGDMDECFCIHTNPLTKYLDYRVNWSLAPSNAYKTNPQMLQDMLDDDTINPFVFTLSDEFVWSAISRKLLDLSVNIKRLVKVTDKNIVNVYEYFCSNVLTKDCKLSEHDKASLFVNRLTNDKNMYLHPKKKGCLITESFGEIKVVEKNYISFFEHFDGSQYSITEKQELVKIVDRIIDDTQRRRSGDFFTPTIWVDEAHKMISEQFGEDWKEKYVVWDCAWGTGNLTRDYKFKELYCSTLSQGEIDVANNNRVNSEATKFQYDFLNDGITDGKIDVVNDTKLPQGLKDAILNGKEIIFLINPPYGTSSNLKLGTSKKDIEKTQINELMVCEKFADSSKNLYAQFLYRILKNKIINNNINICLFSPISYLTGEKFYNFRTEFLNKFGYETSFIFEAKHFADVVDGWGIIFSVFSKNKNNIFNNFKTNTKDLNQEFKIVTTQEKILYNTDGIIRLNEWGRINTKGIKQFDAPQFSSPLNIKQSGYGKLCYNTLGYIHSGTNIVENNMTQVSIFSSTISYSNSNGWSIFPFNFYKSILLFSVRKMINRTWINSKDEYIAPSEEVQETELYKQFQYDSIVYSLFNTSSNQSSMRQVDYKDKKWDIKNEFFWMSKNDMMELADQDGFDDIYHDAKNSDERYVYNLLFGEERIYDKLSPDAKEVLDLATSLVKKTFKMRKVLNDEHIEYHLNTFDAGWYQIKLILKNFYQIDNARFVGMYKAFEDRMRPLVYELGFLK